MSRRVRARLRERDERLGEGVGHSRKAPSHPHVVGRAGERRVDVAEVLYHLLLDVRSVQSSRVDRLRDLLHPHPRVGELRKGVDLDRDLLERALGGELVGRGDGGDDVADVAYLSDRDHGFVVRHGEHAERRGVALSRQDREHAGHRSSARDVDRPKARVRPRAPQDLSHEHARAPKVIGVLGPPADLEGALDVGDLWPRRR